MRDAYAGQRLGLPASGRGSMAGWGRRIAALFIDWFASTLVVIGFFGVERVYGASADREWMVLLVYFLEASILTSLIGGSFGQTVLRIGVISVDNVPLHPVLSVVRHALICLVIPAVIWDQDRRGLHDLAARSICIRR